MKPERHAAAHLGTRCARVRKDPAIEACLHHVLGLYATLDAAKSARDQLVRCGLAASNLAVLQPDGGGPAAEARSGSGADDLALLCHGATARGDGRIIEQALDNVSLFAASPVLGTLMAAGWRASLGGLAGALAGTANGQAVADDAASTEPSCGSAVLVVRTATEQQAALARRIVAASMGDPPPQARPDAEPAAWLLPQAAAPAGTPRRALPDRRRQPDRRGQAPPA